MTGDLTGVVQAIIALMVALVTYRIIPWIEARVIQERRQGMAALARTLVFAAEQVYGAGRGREKLEYVCAELRKRGYEVDLAAIEAAVRGVEAR